MTDKKSAQQKTGLTEIERLNLHGHLYFVFSQIVLFGVDEDIYDLVKSVLDTPESLPKTYQAAEAKSEHYQLFGHQLQPYQSLFLTEEGKLGGTVAAKMEVFYTRCGYQWRNDTEPDYLGVMLDCAAMLCAAQMGALKDGDRAKADEMEKRLKQLLSRHILPWIFPLIMAAIRFDFLYYTDALEMLMDFITKEIERLEIQDNPALRSTVRPFDPLADAEVDLRQVANWLTTPFLSGVILTPADMSELGSDNDLPRGFGKRSQMMLNLLRSSGDYEASAPLLTDIATLISQWRQSYIDLAETIPATQPFMQPWIEKISHTEETLGRMIEALKANE